MKRLVSVLRHSKRCCTHYISITQGTKYFYHTTQLTVKVYLLNKSGYNYGQSQTEELIQKYPYKSRLCLCHMESLSCIVQCPSLDLCLTWPHTPVITGASSFLGVKRLGH